MKNIYRFNVIIILVFSSLSIVAKKHNTVLLPYPQHYKTGEKCFAMKKTKLTSDVLTPELKAFIESAGGEIVEHAPNEIKIELLPSIQDARLNQEEAYRLIITERQIKIEATTERGAYWGLQTLQQLENKEKNKSSFPECNIVDWPAFRIRGFMQDVGRTYISMEELKREIKMLSRYKINTFHWHLTENQAWRLQSKIFPMLNDSAVTTRMPGKFYTLDEARELVDFCKKHHVMLIPEFDMPGHSEAFVRTFRHDMQSPEGMKILKLLLDEVCETFNVPYIHIGTDEATFTNPQFVPQMVEYIRSKGKKIISWSPGWNYKPGEIDMTQLWSYRGKAQAGIPAIDSKFHYINHFDTFADIVALYNSRIYNQNEGSNDIAGTIVAVWNDRYLNNEQNIALENSLYPNMLAIAERAWCGGGSEYFDNYGTIIPNKETQQYKDFVDFERRLLWHKKHNFKGLPFPYLKQTQVEWLITDAFPNEGNLAKSFPPEQELQPSYQYEGKTYATNKAIGAGIYLRHMWGPIVPGFYKDPKPNHTAYAYTWVYSPNEQQVGLWAEFQNYSRSEKDLAPLPNTWDYKKSRIWINNNEIMPPAWSSTHRIKSNEIPLGNENCVARPPLPITLNKGWNKVLIKLPIGKFSLNETRLVKWMFTTVFVTLDGQNAIENIIYSPEKKL